MFTFKKKKNTSEYLQSCQKPHLQHHPPFCAPSTKHAAAHIVLQDWDGSVFNMSWWEYMWVSGPQYVLSMWTDSHQCFLLTFCHCWILTNKFPGRPRDKTFLQNPFKLTALGSQYLTVDQLCERSPTRSSIFCALLGRGVLGDGVLLWQ